MAALNFTAISLRLPEKSYVTGNHRNPISFLPGRRPMKIAAAANSVESSPTLPEKPEIELEFIGEKPGSDGSFPVERAKAVSGEKLLRNIMLDNKIELYAPYISQRPTRVAFSPMNLLSGEEHGKLMNCGGGGSCGTCIVEIIDGKDLLNERTNTELRYLKKKPESWRLACQTIVGNKENSGKVVVQRLPQWKK